MYNNAMTKAGHISEFEFTKNTKIPLVGKQGVLIEMILEKIYRQRVQRTV